METALLKALNHSTMNFVETPFGKLNGVEFHTLFSNRKMDGCNISEANILHTPYGNLVPQYETEDMGRRARKPVYFHKNGALKSIPLQEQTTVTTPAGEIPAELITFYESGALKRIFPLDGKLSGFWSWKNEMALARESIIDTPVARISAKIIAIQFYESGATRSITFWPGQSASITTDHGKHEARTGIAFYENGKIRSYEPLRKTTVPTPIGKMIAYDNEPNGIHGDLNSLQFDREGIVSSLSTIDNEVEVIYPDGSSRLFTPGVKNNVCGDERKVSVPMKIRFENNSVFLNESGPFDRDSHRFVIKEHRKNTEKPSYACTG
uniref:Uncharacterized protein n=1 Tax=Chlorobium phaeobacteroides (strain BS1) TaxID=331678 RepID=B3EJN2_CHLPB